MRLRVAAPLLAVALALAVVDAVVLRLFLAAGLTERPVGVARLTDVSTRPDPDAAAILGPDLRGRDPVALMRAVMDLVPRVEADPSDRLRDLYRRVRAGGGLECAGMARLYFNVLVVNGFRARIVELRRSSLDPWDAHTLVEVFQGGTWRAYDPTFNVAYARGERRLSAEEVQQTFRDGTFATVHPVFFGRVRYPARVETYYMSWLALFNNVYVLDGAQPARILALPPLRYWFGPRLYYSTANGLSTAHVRLIAKLYFTFVGLLPIVVIVTSLGACLLLALEWRARRRARASGRWNPIAAPVARAVGAR